jgi:hypothetical protein
MAGITALLTEARRLGLVWGLRPATAQGDGNYIYDGDQEPIKAVNLITPVSAGYRVMIMFVPPSGNYVVGELSPPPRGRGLFIETSETTSSPAVGTSESTVLSILQVSFPAGRAYEFKVSGGIFSTVAGALAYFRIRNGSALLGEFYRQRTEGGSVMTQDMSLLAGTVPGDGVITADINLNMFISPASGVNTVSHFGSTDRPRRLMCYDIGAYEDYSNLNVIG